MVWESFCEKDTAKIGETLAREAKPGEIYLLEGDLGVGKTVFAKGFALGLGITEPITSPTFTIIQEYEQGVCLFTILMCTGSQMKKKCLNLAMRVTSLDRACA